MQEEVENRTLTLTVNATKFTGRVLKAALSKYLAHRKNKKLQKSRDSPDDVKPYGRVSMEDLKKQYGDMKEIDLQDKGLRSFERIAREYKVQYAVYKTAKGQYQIFFKAPSEASMNAAFQKYSKNRLKKEQRRESLPYLLIGLYATKLGEAWRLAPGADASAKLLGLMDGFAAAFQSALPSFHPVDLLVGLCCGAALRLAVYIKGKNAKKYRKNMEYGSARWSA